jgi:hypothetical protein
MGMQEIMKRLRAPFAPEEIEWRVGATTKDKTKGMALAFVTNRAIQNRLDEVFGCFGWKNEYREWRGNAQLCGISVKYEGEWITKWDGASDTDWEATKGGLSDAMKRAAYQWGIGRYLYNLDPVWVPIRLAGKSYVIDGPPPTLPAWALPEGYKPPKQSAGQRNQETKSQTTKKTITKAQAKKMVALAQNNTELVKQILEPYGYTQLGQILVENYQSICDEIEAEMKRMAP